jgi:hypothetical protein
MRLRLILVLFLLLTSLMLLNAQNLDATATAIIAGATQTAIQELTHTIELETEDPFALTATALVREATQTAEVSTGRTAAPITAEALIEGDFELTATVLVQEATQTAIAATPPSFGTGIDDEDNNNLFALSGTLFIVGGLIVALLVLGAVVVTVGRRNTGKRG